MSWFWGLADGATPAAIAARHGLAPASSARYLQALEKLNLIERLPRDKVRILAEGEPVWTPDGPLSRAFRDALQKELLTRAAKKGNTKLTFYRIPTLEMEQIVRALGDVLQQARRAERAHARGKDVKGFAMQLAWDELEPAFLSNIDEI